MRESLLRRALNRTDSTAFNPFPVTFKIVNSQIDIINRLCREFGLTPSSRSRIVTGQDDEQRADTFLD